MLKRYRKTLSRLDFGRKIKDMFRFVPIEQLDEDKQNYLVDEWERGKAPFTPEFDTVSGNNRLFLGKDEAEVNRACSEKKAARTDGGWKRLPVFNRNTVMKDTMPNGTMTSDIMTGNNVSENIITENIITESATDRAGLFERTGLSEISMNTDSVFDEKVWLAAEGGEHIEKNAAKMIRIFNAERVIEPVLTRIERSAERIERTIRQADERERIMALNEEVLFKERLEGVLRAEMLRNGFDCEGI